MQLLVLGPEDSGAVRAGTGWRPQLELRPSVQGTCMMEETDLSKDKTDETTEDRTFQYELLWFWTNCENCKKKYIRIKKGRTTHSLFRCIKKRVESLCIQQLKTFLHLLLHTVWLQLPITETHCIFFLNHEYILAALKPLVREWEMIENICSIQALWIK